LIESQGIAQWKIFYQTEKGESVVQLLPSGNIMDLTDALTTPIKTLCCFETQEGGNDMVNMGKGVITPNHHILTAEGWMTALQAAARGQGMVFRSMLPRVYNFCLEGGGNILINTSLQPGVTTFTTAATMGYLFTPVSDSQQISSLSYPEDIQTQLGLRQDLSHGHARFPLGDVETLPNGELVFKNTTGDIPPKKRPGTGPKLLQPLTPLLDNSPGAERLRQSEPKTATTLDKTHTSGEPDQGNREKSIPISSDAASSRSLLTNINGDQARLASGKSQPKWNTEHATRELESSYATANKNPQSPKTLHSDTMISPHSAEETQLVQATAQEYWLTPSFTPDTHILILKAGVASWTQIGDARRGATVIQSLPSGNIGDVRGAQSATLEKVWEFEGGGDEIDIVQIGKAYITANHPILTVDGWMLASQAAAKGHGQFLSDREYAKLYSLQLVTGGNILINTYTSPGLPSVHTEAATMGYRFLPPSNPLNRNFPTYSLQGTGLRDGLVAQTKPSYSQVITFNLKRLSSRPIPPFTPLAPETHVPPEFIAEIEKDVKGHRGEPMTGISTTIHLGFKTVQRTSEEYSGDPDAAMTGTNRIRPTGPQQRCREVMQEDGPGCVEDGHGTGLQVQDNQDGSTGSAADGQ